MAIAAPQRIASAKGGPAKGDKTGSGASTDEAGAAKGAKSKKKLIIIAVAVLLLGGVGAKFTVLKAAPSKVPAKPKEGAVLPLDEMTVNLQGGHFLRLQIALQETTKAGTEPLPTAKAQQTIISIFSDRKMTDLAGEKARQAAMDELVSQLEKDYPDKIMGAYYTAFVMQ